MVATDYREWLDQGRGLPEYGGVRLVLMSRFFNNLSDFGIRSYEQGAAADLAGPLMAHGGLECQPIHCLAPGGPGPERLVVSNARVWLGTGRTFKQASLSSYFLGLRLAAGIRLDGLHPQKQDKCVHLSVRAFRPDCLLTRQGGSVLGAFARQADLVVIQDADMRATDLKAHCCASHLGDLLVLETTRKAGLRGHFSHLVAQRADPLVERLSGERIW